MIKDLLARDVPITCTACGWSFAVERTAAGMACNCPECGELLDVPLNTTAGVWKRALLGLGVLIAGGVVWTLFFAAPAPPVVPDPETKKSLTKKLELPELPRIEDEIPFVSQDKSLPGKLPQVVDLTPPGDPFVTPPPVEPLVNRTTKPAQDDKTEDPTPDPTTRPAPSNSSLALDDAVAAFRRNDLAKTQDILKEARIRFPDLPPLTFMLAELYLTHSNIPAGRAELEKVAVEDPEYPGTYLMFANLALSEGRITDAKLLLERAQSLEKEVKDPDRLRTLQTNIRSGKVTLYEARKDWLAVIESANEWLKIDPKSGRARQRLARALLAKGQPQEAARELELARSEDKKLATADIAMATFYSEFGDLKSAEEALLRAAKAQPKDPLVQQAVANWLLTQDRAQDALPFITESLKLDPTSTDARYAAGLIARQMRDYNTAESSFESVLRDAPANFAASNQLALVLAEQEDEAKHRRAVEIAEVNARQYPRNGEAVATLGWAYYRSGKLEQAEKSLQTAISGGRATSDTAYFMAHVMADRGRIDDAARLLQGALRAPGTFAFRKEAQAWLDRITSKPKN